MVPFDWPALRDDLASSYPVIKRLDDWICLGAPPGKPEQTIQVTTVKAHGLSRVFLVADICPASQVSARDALELAVKLLIGGIYIRRDILALRQVLTEGRFTIAGVHDTIALLGDTAVHYRDELLQRKARATGTLYDGDRF